jgi:hypothetical protein
MYILSCKFETKELEYSNLIRNRFSGDESICTLFHEIIQGDTKKGRIPMVYFGIYCDYGVLNSLERTQWVFAKKYIFEHKKTGDILQNIWKIRMDMKEMTIQELESIQGYQNLRETERDELRDKIKHLKRPKKIIIHRD